MKTKLAIAVLVFIGVLLGCLPGAHVGRLMLLATFDLSANLEEGPFYSPNAISEVPLRNYVVPDSVRFAMPCRHRLGRPIPRP